MPVVVENAEPPSSGESSRATGIGAGGRVANSGPESFAPAVVVLAGTREDPHRTPGGGVIALAGRRQRRSTTLADGPPRRRSLAATEWMPQANRTNRSASRPPRWSRSTCELPNRRSAVVQALPRLRSRGGWGAGPSDQPGRRGPRVFRAEGRVAFSTARVPRAEALASNPTAEFVEAARLKHLHQRGFRIHQLRHLDTSLPDAVSDPARTEIHVALRATAGTVLTDKTLRKIQQGNYGRCLKCGAMSKDRLGAPHGDPVWIMPMHTRHARRRRRGSARGQAWLAVRSSHPSRPRARSTRRHGSSGVGAAQPTGH